LEFVAEALGEEFLIADTPAVSFNPARPTVGLLGGVPYPEATTILLPLGPRHLACVARKPAWFHLEPRWVRSMNSVQVAQVINSLEVGGSSRCVFYRPGLNLADSVKEVLDQPRVGDEPA
jgi:hypothetical protein